MSWKQYTWIVFHNIAKSYDDSNKDRYNDFFESFKVVIPCKICREHYKKNVSENDMNIYSNLESDKIFNWTVNLHNTVNRMHGKSQWSYDKASDFYNKNGLPFLVIKFFIFEYIAHNFKKGPEKTENLFKMLKSLAYVYPDREKRDKLIDFTSKFQLNRESLRNWVLAYLVILK